MNSVHHSDETPFSKGKWLIDELAFENHILVLKRKFSGPTNFHGSPIGLQLQLEGPVEGLELPIVSNFESQTNFHR